MSRRYSAVLGTAKVASFPIEPRLPRAPRDSLYHDREGMVRDHAPLGSLNRGRRTAA